MSNSETGYTRDGIKYIACNNYLLVELCGVPPRNSSIIIAGEEQEKERLLVARPRGIVRDIGHEAVVQCKVGDQVSFRSYSGTDVNRNRDGSIPADGILFRWITDQEIMGIIKEEEKQ